MTVVNTVVVDVLADGMGAFAGGIGVGCYCEGENREDLSEEEDDGKMHVWDGGLVRSSVDGCMEGCVDG